jgi:hypothetical protein
MSTLARRTRFAIAWLATMSAAVGIPRSLFGGSIARTSNRQPRASTTNSRYRDRSQRCSARLLLAAAAVILAAGCAEIDQPVGSVPEFQSADIDECVGWFTKLDEIIDHAGVRDAEAYRIPGFRELRVNRFLASFREQAKGDPVAFVAWQKRLRELDARARDYELKNLPPRLLATLEVNSRSDAAARTDRCAAALARRDAASSSRQGMLVERAQVPDDYADWKRTVGLYPAVRVPFFAFAKKWQNEATEMFERAASGTAEPQNIIRYQPPESTASAQRIASLLANTKTDALGIPQFGDREGDILFAAFAPIFEIETTGDYDRFGPLKWRSGETPEVDISRPTAYRRFAFTRYRGRTLLQLVYMIWFPERPQSSSFDPLSGKLDGIVFRVTLDPTGRPLIYDSIHLCGCYHMFFPTPRARPIPPPDPQIEWAFVPRSLPAIEAPQRVLVRLTSRSHYLTDVRPDMGGHGVTYTTADDGGLRTLPTADGTRSAFGPTGIVPGTDRSERLATWPLGIESAGAMREWGRHATALVGRRQFDDADLIERRFEILPSAQIAATRVATESILSTSRASDER